MSKDQKKLMADLQRILSAQNFKSEAEVNTFLADLMKNEIPIIPKSALSPEEIAQDLVIEAYDMPPVQAKAAIEKALQINPDCIEAYEFLASFESIAEIAIVFYEKGIAIGRTLFGGSYLTENKGHFWLMYETRPFMRCLQFYADCLYTMGKVRECVSVYEEMISLNPNDNQGVRDLLLLYLIEINEPKKFIKYEKMYKEDGMTFSLLNRALFAFKTEGETDKSNQLLAKALKQNKFVGKKLLSNKPIQNLPDHYGFGDKNEADFIASYAQHVWGNTKGAKEWLQKHSSKKK